MNKRPFGYNAITQKVYGLLLSDSVLHRDGPVVAYGVIVCVNFVSNILRSYGGYYETLRVDGQPSPLPDSYRNGSS